MKRVLLVLLLLIVFVSSVVYAAAKPPQPIITDYSQDVESGHGIIKFDKLKVFIVKDRYVGTNVYIFGNIYNDTGKNWDNLKFNIQYMDNLGRIIYTGDMKVYNLKRDSSKTIGYEEYNYSNNYSNKYDVYGHDYIGTIDLKAVTNIKILLESSNLSGTSHAILVEPQESQENAYSDQLTDISFSLSQGSSNIGFILKNKTSLPIKVDWNQVSFVSMSGKATKVIHEGIKLNNSGENQSPTYIPPRAALSDLIAPTSHYYWSEGWKYIPILPSGEEALLSVGRTFSVYLPLEINGEMQHYNFVFKIDKAENR